MLSKLVLMQRRHYSVKLFIVHAKYRVDEAVRTVKNIQFEYLHFPDRLRGTIAEKWADYWKNLALDYCEVYRDTVKNCRDNPSRFFLLLSLTGLASSMALSNPDEVSFRDALIRRGNELALIGPSVRNPKAVEYVRHMEDMYNQGTVRYLSLGVVSLVWAQDYNSYVNVFRANCTYLQPRYVKMYERVVDFGLFNKWWVMDRRMIDYDVNPEEWRSDETAVA